MIHFSSLPDVNPFNASVGHLFNQRQFSLEELLHVQIFSLSRSKGQPHPQASFCRRRFPLGSPSLAEMNSESPVDMVAQGLGVLAAHRISVSTVRGFIHRRFRRVALDNLLCQERGQFRQAPRTVKPVLLDELEHTPPGMWKRHQGHENTRHQGHENTRRRTPVTRDGEPPEYVAHKMEGFALFCFLLYSLPPCVRRCIASHSSTFLPPRQLVLLLLVVHPNVMLTLVISGARPTALRVRECLMAFHAQPPPTCFFRNNRAPLFLTAKSVSILANHHSKSCLSILKSLAFARAATSAPTSNAGGGSAGATSGGAGGGVAAGGDTPHSYKRYDFFGVYSVWSSRRGGHPFPPPTPLGAWCGESPACIFSTL